MGRRRRTLPAPLDGAVVRTEDAAAWGIGRSRLRRDDVHRPYRGATAFGPPADTTRGRCEAYEAIRRGGQFFSHITAALLWGIPLPRACDDAPLHVSVEHPRTAPRRPGIVGHSIRVSAMRIDDRGGLPVTPAPDTWCQLASMLSRDDLVAAGDYLISERRVGEERLPAIASIEELRAAASRYAGGRGAKAIAWALPRLRTGVASRPESHLRLLVTEAGLPEPLVADPTAVEGGMMLHPDLKFPRQRVVLEYEGDGHRSDPVQWRRDLTRREMLEAAGWRVIRVTSDDLYVHPRQLLARIRHHLATTDARIVPPGRY